MAPALRDVSSSLSWVLLLERRGHQKHSNFEFLQATPKARHKPLSLKSGTRATKVGGSRNLWGGQKDVVVFLKTKIDNKIGKIDIKSAFETVYLPIFEEFLVP